MRHDVMQLMRIGLLEVLILKCGGILSLKVPQDERKKDALRKARNRLSSGS